MPLFDLDGVSPVLPEDGSAWIAPGAMLIGAITLGSGVSIWFNAVLRGDNERITIGEDTNVQDGCVFHTDPGFPLTIGAGVTVGHKAILHGCTVGDGCLIGMGAVVMNGARIGKDCLLAANALVTEGKEIPDRTLVVGQPAKGIRTLDDATVRSIREASTRYSRRRDQYRSGLRPIGDT